MAKYNTPEYAAWNRIKTRCYNPNCDQYKNYGGRGIKMCGRWFNSFENFLADMGPRPTEAHSLDRIDFNGNYSPENCRWADIFQQNNNTRKNVFLTIGADVKTIAQWSRISGISPTLIWVRLHRGWSHEEAAFKPARKLRRANHLKQQLVMEKGNQ